MLTTICGFCGSIDRDGTQTICRRLYAGRSDVHKKYPLYDITRLKCATTLNELQNWGWVLIQKADVRRIPKIMRLRTTYNIYKYNWGHVRGPGFDDKVSTLCFILRFRYTPIIDIKQGTTTAIPYTPTTRNSIIGTYC